MKNGPKIRKIQGLPWPDSQRCNCGKINSSRNREHESVQQILIKEIDAVTIERSKAKAELVKLTEKIVSAEGSVLEWEQKSSTGGLGLLSRPGEQGCGQKLR